MTIPQDDSDQIQLKSAKIELLTQELHPKNRLVKL